MRFWLVLFAVIVCLFVRLFFGVVGDASAFILLFFAIMWQGYVALQVLVRREWDVDIIALLAMVGALFLHAWWAGLVIVFMLVTGEWLEMCAFARARSELRALLARAPTMAHVKVGSAFRDVPVQQLIPGQMLIVKPGEIIPADSLVVTGVSCVDASHLTGEPLPYDVGRHDRVLAGSINQSAVLTVRVSVKASESQYQRLQALVTEAQAQKAPLVRLADRFSGWFTLLAFAMAGLAWILSGDPSRALAVLVVATPCPLILATPVAFLSGMNRAFARGIIVKHGGALELLARARTVVFDKTGTLTFGMPKIRRVISAHLREHEVIRLAASLDQGSTHILARALIEYARDQKIALHFPTQFREYVGQGVVGFIEQHRFTFGRLSFLQEQGVRVPAHVHGTHERNQRRGERSVYLARGTSLIATIIFSDVLRPGLRAFFDRLRARGIRHVALVTGDRKGSADRVARAIGIEEVHPECLPEDKLEIIRRAHRMPKPIVMVGDGVNDAPALAAADVGVTLMGGVGEGASSEAADVVMMTDDITRFEELLQISRRTVGVAKTGMFVGMGLSFGLMVLALVGLIQPFAGAWLQELVDVTVILQALRARRA